MARFTVTHACGHTHRYSLEAAAGAAARSQLVMDLALQPCTECAIAEAQEAPQQDQPQEGYRFHYHQYDGNGAGEYLGKETREYRGMDIQEAARQFYAAVVKSPTNWHWSRCEDLNTHGEEPARAVMNWERDPDAEVSDGWLSNLAHHWTESKARLVYQPQFCVHRVTWSVLCPFCGASYTSSESYGQYGRYVRCDSCQRTMGTETKRFARACQGLASVCGSPMESRINQNGIAYEACPACHPEGDYERATIGELMRGKRNRY